MMLSSTNTEQCVQKKQDLSNEKKSKDSNNKKMTSEKPPCCLCDTGTSASIMVQDSMAKCKNMHHEKKKTIWKMAGGDCETSETTPIDFE